MEDLDKQIIQLPCIKDIFDMCTRPYTLTICSIGPEISKICKDFDLDEIEIEQHYFEYDDDCEYIVYIMPSFNEDESITSSVSHYGYKDYHLTYSTYTHTFDDPLKHMNEVESLYFDIEDIKETMINIKENPNYTDVELMSPHARSLDGGNVMYMIGFNNAT
jgi:hypothetical protein